MTTLNGATVAAQHVQRIVLALRTADGVAVDADPAKMTPLTTQTVAAPVASSATVVTLIAANAARRALKVFNDSTQVLYVKDGAAASATDHSVQVAAGGYYEWPLPIYTGVISGLWVAANGFARLTEGV